MNWLMSWYLESPFATMDWVDYVDILLLTYIVYRLLMVIRGTRGQQIIIGLFLIGGVFLGSKAGGLSTMSWVLDHMAVYVVLALLILFQEDVRRALARAGGTFFRGSLQPTSAHQMEEVVKAMFFLAHRKIGALVAIERTGALGRYAEDAHPLHAKLSAELLQSLFHPSSPLHDGAVILQGGEVLAAGVFVPISMNKEIPRSYGTRHRAAIGLTESTDAICLVVSEERGTVALVRWGEITPVADANELRALLQETLEEQATRPASGVGDA
jgi:diadenylate cyclase